MNIGFHNFYNRLNNNRMFETSDAGIGDDILYPMVRLRQRLEGAGHSAATIDTAPLDSFDAVVFCDYPTKFNARFRRLLAMSTPVYLMLFESPAVRPDNWNVSNHAPFRKVFTWSPLLEGEKYVRFRMPVKLPDKSQFHPNKAEKLCCMIASQKYSWVKEELYTERVRAIRWFELNHPEDFDLYGQRWGNYYFEGKASLINPLLARLYGTDGKQRQRSDFFPSWRGSVGSKRAVLQHYKFCICYENASYPGWITEKIWDAMFAGCVPIYLGDREIYESVPNDAFVDGRQFKDYEKLYDYLCSMPPSIYESKRRAGHDCVHGEAAKQFGAEAFCDAIIREVVC